MLPETKAEALNRDCDCSVVDLANIRGRIDSVLGGAQSIVHSHPHLFSEIPVFIAPEDLAGMQRAIDAIETVVRLPAWQSEVLAVAPAIARTTSAQRGVFFGYDFHIGAGGPRLIE